MGHGSPENGMQTASIYFGAGRRDLKVGQARFEERVVRQFICIDLLFLFRRFAFGRDQHGGHVRIRQSSYRNHQLASVYSSCTLFAITSMTR